jgi:hypothetical protein
VRIKLTENGREARDIVEALYHKHVPTVEHIGGINADEFCVLNKALHKLELSGSTTFSTGSEKTR